MIHEFPYKELLDVNSLVLPNGIILVDHLGGFNKSFQNAVLYNIDAVAKQQNIICDVTSHQVLDNSILCNYPSLNYKFSPDMQDNYNINKFHDYVTHPELKYKNFICSFNGSPHVSRKLLVAILEKFKYCNPDYCSKNFAHDIDTLDGHIVEYIGDRDNFYRKFFIKENSEEFFQSINSFGHTRFDHANNIYNLESKLTQSFLHIVSETMATSYVPFVTEKFLYSIVTRGLFLAYAQPGWHAHLEKYYGFKRYTELFDYRFDSIVNPVERLIELMSMISKFSVLSTADWHDLYVLEQDTIEYNYNHYFSGNYLKCLKYYE